MKQFFRSSIAGLMSVGFIFSAIACTDSTTQSQSQSMSSGNQESGNQEISYVDTLLTQMQSTKSITMNFELETGSKKLEYVSAYDDNGAEIYAYADYMLNTKGSMVIERTEDGSINTKILFTTTSTTTDKSVPDELKVQIEETEEYSIDGNNYYIYKADDGTKHCISSETEDDEISRNQMIASFFDDISLLKDETTLKEEIEQLFFSENTLMNKDTEGNVSFGFEKDTQKELNEFIEFIKNLSLDTTTTGESLINQILSNLGVMKDEENVYSVADLLEFCGALKNQTLGTVQSLLETLFNKTLDEVKDEFLSSEELKEFIAVLKKVVGNDVKGQMAISQIEAVISQFSQQTVEQILNTYLATEDYKTITLEDIFLRLLQIGDISEDLTDITWDGIIEDIQSFLAEPIYDILDLDMEEYFLQILSMKDVVEKITIDRLKTGSNMIFSKDNLFKEFNTTVDIAIQRPIVGVEIDTDNNSFLNTYEIDTNGNIIMQTNIVKAKVSITMSSTAARIALPENVVIDA